MDAIGRAIPVGFPPFRSYDPEFPTDEQCTLGKKRNTTRTKTKSSITLLLGINTNFSVLPLFGIIYFWYARLHT
jgi:hypothetical protein